MKEWKLNKMKTVLIFFGLFLAVVFAEPEPEPEPEPNADALADFDDLISHSRSSLLR